MNINMEGISSEDGFVTIKLEHVENEEDDEDSRISDTELIVPEMMVSVEVEERDDQALDFSCVSVVGNLSNLSNCVLQFLILKKK